MKTLIALVLLVAGVCVAATAGSQLGAEQALRSPHEAQLALSSRVIDKVRGCDQDAVSALTAPENVTAEVEAARVACREEALKPWGDNLHAARAAGDSSRTFIESRGRLEPGVRLGDWWKSAGLTWLVGLGLIVAGAVLGRRAAYEKATAPTHADSATPTFEEAVSRLRLAIASISPQVAALADGSDLPQARTVIESLEADVITPVVEDRARYLARFGVAGFAEFFGPFSAGERNLARAWSALTDGYPHVASEALATADASFEQAQHIYARLST